MASSSSKGSGVGSWVSSPAVMAAEPLAGVKETPGGSNRDDSDSSVSTDSESLVEEKVKQPVRSFIAPKVWMIVFGIVLAVCAGAVDVVTFRGLAVFVSHVTGTTAKIGARMEGVTKGMNEHWDVLHSMLLVGCFIVGAFVCGLVIPGNQVHFGGKSFYGVALLANSGMLIAAAFAAPGHPVKGDEVLHRQAIAAGCLCAMACGLQNAMCTMHFGAIVRTTHVTGTATDIGSTAGRAAMILLRNGCRHRRASIVDKSALLDDATKLMVLVPIFLGFFSGTVLGAFLHSEIGIYALLVPGGITGTAGLLYTFFRNFLKRQLKKLEERRVQEEMLEVDAALQRAETLLRAASAAEVGEEDLGNLDDLLGHSLRVAHDLEATIAEVLEGRRGGAEARLPLDRSRTF